MSIGLPQHLVPGAVARALARAAHGMALAAIVAGLFITLGFASAYPTRVLWPAMLALLCMLPALAWVDKKATPLAGIVYLVVGAASAFVYVVVLATQMGDVIGDAAFWYSPAKMAVVLVAGPGLGLLAGLGWTFGGFIVAEGAAAAALLVAGRPVLFDPFNLGLLAEAIAICILAYVTARRATRSQPRFQRAAHDELLDDIRSRMELRAAALMHDTILSHLAAIATSTNDSMPPEQKARIERDLNILLGQEWLSDAAGATNAGGEDRARTALSEAIQEVREAGLDVTGTGDFAAVSRLEPAQAEALGLAAKQCLINVIKHSGVMVAEVAVYASDDELSVMIIDAGRGFSDSAVGADRLGLRASVHNRIESVGGSVQVWSTPGSGTSVLMQLPANPQSRDGDYRPDDSGTGDEHGDAVAASTVQGDE
ncbi:sensor histidine kinase [Salinibacterium hongtaonis]|nr:ATP-binding protein [Salinibacterium hongtaonis]